MIITLTGSNNFALKAELDQLTSGFIKNYSEYGLQRLDGEEVEFDTMREALESLPFLASKKLVVLRSPGANKDFTDNAEILLSNLSDAIDVVIYEPKLDKRSAYYKYLKKHTEFKEFNELDEFTLAKWLTQQATVQGSTLYSEDARYLVERVGTSQMLLNNELAKLVAYDKKITRETIDLLTEPTPQSTIFELLDAAFAGNARLALNTYQEQRASKVEPQQIIAMLVWQLHILAIVKTAGNRNDASVASEAKISPYVVGKSRKIANNLTLPKLKQLINQLLQLDINLKTKTIDADDALQAYLLSIST